MVLILTTDEDTLLIVGRVSISSSMKLFFFFLFVPQ